MADVNPAGMSEEGLARLRVAVTQTKEGTVEGAAPAQFIRHDPNAVKPATYGVSTKDHSIKPAEYTKPVEGEPAFATSRKPKPLQLTEEYKIPEGEVNMSTTIQSQAASSAKPSEFSIPKASTHIPKEVPQTAQLEFPKGLDRQIPKANYGEVRKPSNFTLGATSQTADIESATKAAAERSNVSKLERPTRIPEAQYKPKPPVHEAETKESVGAFKKAFNWMKKPFVEGAAYESKLVRGGAAAGRIAIAAVPVIVVGKMLSGGKSEPESYTYPENDNARGGFAAAEDARREAASAEIAR